MSTLEKLIITDLEIDRRSGETIAHQIARHIEEAIRSGSLASGARLPSWMDLAAQLGVARGTIRSAYEKLIDRNLISTAGSAGTRVSNSVEHSELAYSASGEQLLPPDAEYRTDVPLLFQLGIPAYDGFPATLWGRLHKQAVQTISMRVSHPDPRGVAELREAVASHVAIARGVRCSPDQVIITGGFRPALAMAVEATGARGRQAWMEDPGYPITRVAFETMGVQTVAVPVDRFGLDVERGEELAPSAALAVVTPGQQAPTGVTLTSHRREKLLRWAQNANSWIVEDDYLAELQLEGRSPAALAGNGADRVIHIGTFSKTLSPMIGIGFIVAPRLLARRLVDTATWLNAPPNMAVQLALARFLREGHYLRHLRRMRDIYSARRELLLKTLNDVGIRSAVPAALSVLITLPPGYDDQYICQVARGAGLGPAPLSLWFSASSPGRSGLLLSVTNVAESRIDESCLRLKRYLDTSRTVALPYSQPLMLAQRSTHQD